MANVNTNTDLPKSNKINGRFINPWPTWKTPTFYNLIRFLMERNHSSIPSKEEVGFTILLDFGSRNNSSLHSIKT
jgi:hypothetical protein